MCHDGNIWCLLQDAGMTFLLVVLLAVITTASDAIKKKYLNQANLTKLQELENAAHAAVMAAEQKIDNVETLVDNVVGAIPDNPETEAYKQYWNDYKQQYDRLKTLTNEQKKNLVMDFLKSKFPDLPVEQLEIYLEKAYLEYKESRLE